MIESAAIEIQLLVMRCACPAALFLAALVAGATSCGASSDPPTLSFFDHRVTELGSDRIRIRFDTSRPTTGVVEYGLRRDRLDQLAADPFLRPGALATRHAVDLEDLAPDTEYWYRARAEDFEGRVYESGLRRFRTWPAEPAPAYVNLALEGAVPDASSIFGGGPADGPWGPVNAVDDRMSTAWVTDADGDGAWLELDLGPSREIAALGFRSREGEAGSGVITAVRFLLDGVELGPFDTPDPDHRYLFPLDPPRHARTVRLEAVASTGGNTGVRELQVFSLP